MKNAPTPEENVVVGKRSLVSFGVLYGAIGLTAVCAFKGAMTLSAIDSKLNSISAKVAEAWSTRDQVEWTLRLQNENPALKVPDPVEPTRRRNSVAGNSLRNP